MNSDICTNCGQPKTSGKSGTLTQWIFVCRCASLQAQSESIESYRFQVCKKCGKRVGTAREGSLTQFVFRYDLCSCDTPDALDVAIARTAVAEQVEAYIEPGKFGDNIEGLELPPESFPTDRFKPIRELGKGTSGTVYMCIDRFLGTEVAVKVLHYLSTDQLLSFQQEARAISKLTHPNIVKILDFGATNSGIPYMVLEYIDGVDLETYIQQNGLLRIEEAVDLIASMCNALANSHSKGIFHRDLKPSNILVSKNNDRLMAKLVDFGVARVKFETIESTVLHGTTFVGTPAYMSPDQMRGLSYDARSEIYSLGCILFELVAGRQVYSAETVLELVNMHVSAPVPRLAHTSLNDVRDRVGESLERSNEILTSLDDIITRCLSKEAASRYQNVSDLKSDLEAVFASPRANLYVGTDHTEDSADVNQESVKSDQQKYAEELKKGIRQKDFVGNEKEENRKAPGGDRIKRIRQGVLLLATLVVVVGGLGFFQTKHTGVSVDPKNEQNTKKPGAIYDTLMETNFQLNKFNGEFWSFNMRLITDASLDELMHAKHNTRLWLDSGDISPAGFLKLKPIGVVSMALMNMKLSSEHFDALKQLNTIRQLRLFEIHSMSDRNLKQLSEMNNLRELFIKSNYVTDKGVKHLENLKDLKMLSLDRCRKLTDECLDSIEKMKSLKRLSVSATGVTKAGVLRIAKMKNLTTICVNELPLDSDCVKEFAKRDNIERLSIRGAKITQEDIDLLSRMKSLELLDLRGVDLPAKKTLNYFVNQRKLHGIPPCDVLSERRTGIDSFGEMVYDTLDDEHMWVDEIKSSITSGTN